MTYQVGVIMDPISQIKTYKDSTFAILLEAQRQGHTLIYMEPQDIFLKNDIVYGRMTDLTIEDTKEKWFTFGDSAVQPLDRLDIVLMRQDPPINLDYIYNTYLLELVAKKNTLVINNPRSLRDVNEKLFTAWFPECCPETLVTSQMQLLRNFLQEQQDIICKPLHGMGGASVFRLQKNDPNISVVLETLTQHGQQKIMAQKYITEIKQGDKRILMIDGEPVPFALARMPADGETRANLAAGGTGVIQELSERDRWICQQVGPTLRERGLLFVGLDVIGDYLTEINVTSPTCIREIEAGTGLNICEMILSAVTKAL